ncbi:hypothetical protein TNCV_2174461 [Trichonephila clavipes]|nr:hypothetical protein TNCV_2174461 [Trichonephila clavipes]
MTDSSIVEHMTLSSPTHHQSSLVIKIRHPRGFNDVLMNRNNTDSADRKPVDVEVIPDGITHTVVYTEELVNSTDSKQEEIMDSHINRT